MLLLLDQENVTGAVAATAVTGSWNVKEFELLLLNHGKCRRRKVEPWNSHRSEIKLLQLLRGS